MEDGLSAISVQLAALSDRVDRLATKFETLRADLCGEMLDRRIDDRVSLLLGQQQRMPAWVPWLVGLLLTVCSALIVYVLTGTPPG